MALQPLGVKAVIENLESFLGGMKKMSGGIQDVGDRAQGIGGRLAGAAGAVGRLGVAAAGAAITGIGILGGAMAKLAIDAAPLEGVKSAFEGLTSGIEGGSEVMLAAMKEASAGMVTNAELMRSFNLAAQLVGEDFAVRLPDAMGYLGKVAAATGQDMGYMMDSLVRGVGRLSPMILDNLGIQVDLTEAYQRYADEQGIVASEMTKTQQQTALMNAVMEQLAINTAKMPEVTGTAAQQFAAMKTTLQDVKDEVGLALLPVLMPLITRLGEIAADILPKVVDWFSNKLVPALQGVWKFIQEKIIPIVMVVVGWFKDKIPDAVGEASGWFNTKLLPVLTTIWEFLRDHVIPFVRAFARVVGEVLRLAFEGLAAVWNTILKPALTAIWEFLKDKLQPVFDAVKLVIDKVTEAFNWFADQLAKIHLPDWLISGSPTPFEKGLRGISAAMQELSRQTMPQFAMATTGLAAVPSPARSLEQNFNLAIHTSAPYEPIIADYQMLAAMSERS